MALKPLAHLQIYNPLEWLFWTTVHFEEEPRGEVSESAEASKKHQRAGLQERGEAQMRNKPRIGCRPQVRSWEVPYQGCCRTRPPCRRGWQWGSEWALWEPERRCFWEKLGPWAERQKKVTVTYKQQRDKSKCFSCGSSPAASGPTVKAQQLWS